jgi:hypothetical protein
MAMTPAEKAEFDKLKKELEELKSAKAPQSTADLEASVKAKREEAELQERIAKAVGDVQEINRQKLIQNQQDLLLLQQIEEAALNGAANEAEKLEVLKRLKETFGDLAADAAGLNAMQEENSRLLEISNNEGEKYKNTFESIATHIGMSNKGFAGLISGATKLGEELSGNAAKQAEFARAFVSTFNITNALAGVFTAFAESMVSNLIALDKASSAFAAATGAGRGFTGVIQEAQANSRAFNVTLEESGVATTALFGSLIGFRDASNATQVALVELTSQLGKFGVDGATAANVLNFFATNLGKSTEQSEALIKQLAMMGPRIGITTEKITKDFQAALPTLAVYGDRSIEVFQGIAGAARLAGVETSKMLDLANKFDTFSEGAETAGKLNAILGTQISSMELLRMEEDERVESLIRSVQATGVAFDQLGRFEQKAIAAAAGINDISEAQRIFGMSLSAYRDQQTEMDKSAKIQEEFNKSLQDVMKIGEKFQALFTRFVPIITPALEIIHDFADSIANLLDKMSPEQQRNIGLIVMGISGLVVGLSMLAPLIMTLSGLASGLSTIGVVGPAASVGLKGIGVGLKGLGTALANPKVLLGIGALTAAISALIYVSSLYQEQIGNQEEAKTRQIEANTALAESFKEIGGNLETLSTATFAQPIAGLQAMAQALGKFEDVSVDARATLTNLALISAGKAADSASNAKIVAAGAATISNNINNSFAPSLVLEIDGEQFNAKVKRQVVDTVTANS